MLVTSRISANLAIVAMLAMLCTGCAAIPNRHVHPVYHNPFPQLHRIAILPFFNQSKEPTVDGDELAIAYYNELQSIPGFEVVPVGVTRRYLEAAQLQPRSGSDFQMLARLMQVDAVIVGSVTEYSPYYPPRIGLSVDWYAANPGFHAIPAGYGLPWGTAEEEFIPSSLVREAEFALAREQLKTQTPMFEDPGLRAAAAIKNASSGVNKTASHSALSAESASKVASATSGTDVAAIVGHEPVPPWPDPRGFIPLAPSEKPPVLRPQYEPIITHTRIYHGQDAEFTQRLEHYYETRDDARFGGWQTYLQRPSDFIRFCCYLHVTETLAARGGAGESRVAWRWPISR